MAACATKEGSGAAVALPASLAPDALAPALTLGERAVPGGFAVWTGLALLTHAVFLVWALGLIALREMADLFREMRESQRMAFTISFVDVDVEKKVEPPKPPPPPDPVPEPAPAPAPAPAPKVAAAPPPKDDPYDPPPAPAQATKVLTTDDEPVDLTGQGFVTGDGTGPGYGQVSAAGTGTVPTRSPHAALGGAPGGTGTGPPQAPPPPGPDLSRPAGIVGSTSWNCPFPPEADAEQIDSARAVVVVTVRTDGSPMSVKVVSDPGHGFGRAARGCALVRRYTPALGRDGRPVVSTTSPIGVTFTR